MHEKAAKPMQFLKIYCLILFFSPSFYILCLEVGARIAGKTLFAYADASPLIAAILISGACDFLLSVISWLDWNRLTKTQDNYVRFMQLQVASQLLTGNLLCLVLAIFGLRQGKDVAGQGKVPSQAVAIAYFCLAMAIICGGFYLSYLLKG